MQTLTMGLTAALFYTVSANAGGSIGGDCCTDLEERVAEIEATAVRKGNRKVSLKISGHVNKILIWDPRNEKHASSTVGEFKRDADIWDSVLSQSRFRLTGSAKVTADFSAGFISEFGIRDRGTQTFNECRQCNLWLKSETFGLVSLGRGSTASDGSTEGDLSGTNFLGGGTLSYLHLSPAHQNNEVGFGTIWSGFSNLDGLSRRNRALYKTPVVGGIQFSVSYSYSNAADGGDAVDGGLRYNIANETYQFHARAGIWHENNSNTTSFGGSASFLHKPTGLNITVASADNDTGFDYYFVQGGIRKNIFPAGQTNFSLGYYESTTADRITGTMVQEIDAAAMKLYASFTHGEDVNGEDNVFLLGGVISF